MEGVQHNLFTSTITTSFLNMADIQFASPAEEIAHLKKVLEDKQQELDEVESSFSEFQEFSKQLEEEMEQELQASEKKYAELLSQHKRLKEEHENTVERMTRSSKESSTLINNLQEELSRVTQSRNLLQQNIRKLEQENDTLEQRERVLTVSVGDLQDRLERVMEENVWLQSELDEQRIQSDEQIQRLRDEIRDLKLEISIMERKNATKHESSHPKLKREHSTTQKDHEKEGGEGKPRPSKSPRRAQHNTLPHPHPHTHPLQNNQPNIGAAAISMVSDMLNLVKDLEVRIATYRHNKTFVTPAISPRGGNTDLQRSGSVTSRQSGMVSAMMETSRSADSIGSTLTTTSNESSVSPRSKLGSSMVNDSHRSNNNNDSGLSPRAKVPM